MTAAGSTAGVDLDELIARLDPRAARGQPEQETRCRGRDGFIAQSADLLPRSYPVADPTLGREASVARRGDDIGPTSHCGDEHVATLRGGRRATGGR